MLSNNDSSNNDSSNSHAHDPVVIRDNNKENLASFLETLKQITWSSLDGYHAVSYTHLTLPTKRIV